MVFGGMSEGFDLQGIRDEFKQGNQRQAELELATNNARSIREMEFQFARLLLANQALWELLRDRLGISEAELEQKMQEIDLRDGKPDGQISFGPVRCPSCNRVSNSKHNKCLYCGQLFEKPAIGL